MLKRAPFLFYVDPPQLFDVGNKVSHHQESLKKWRDIQKNIDDMRNVKLPGPSFINISTYSLSSPRYPYSNSISTSSDGYIFETVVDLLDTLKEYRVADIDKVIRSFPNILLETDSELRSRLDFLYDLVSDSYAYIPTINSSMVSQFSYVPPRSSGRFSTDIDNKQIEKSIKEKTTQNLNSLLMAYPIVLSIEYK
jgi:hypothetical protein